MGKRVQQVLLKNLNTETLRLGYVGENVHTQIIFSCIEIYDDYPNAVATMLVQPPRGDTYPATIVRDGSRVLWDLTASDLLYAGAGRVQLTFTNNEEIIRTIIGSTVIQDSIEGSGEAPVPVDQWVNTLDTARASAEAAAEMIDGLTVSAEAGQSVSATVSDVDGHKHIDFVFPTASYTFDNTPTAGSTNPVTSKGIKTALDAKQDTLSFDTEPTASSTKPVTSGGIKTALDAKQNTLSFDNSPTQNSTNPVKSGGVYTALQAKQNTLTFDSQPIANSTNPVTSGGVKTALDAKQGTLTFDSTPTQSSANPVRSGGVYTAVKGAKDYADGIVEVSDEEPVSEGNKLWIDESETDIYTVPTMADMAEAIQAGKEYVTPQMFGAKGDGVTDDTVALNECLHYAMDNNCAAYLPMGTYITTSSGLTKFSIADGQSLIVFGDGQGSIIKRKDDSLPEYQGSTVWAQMFTVEISPTTNPAKDVIFSNFCIDSNRRNQSNATSGYTHEASADISIRNGESNMSGDRYLDRFIVENMRFYDPVADCVNVSGTAQIKIKRVIIDKMVATDRHGTRNDIGFTACPMEDVIINDCMCGSIHFEFNYRPTAEELRNFCISNCSFGYVSLASRINLIMHDCKVDKNIILEALERANISNCYFYNTKSGGYIRNVAQAIHWSYVTFNNCVFFLTKENGNATYTLLREGVDVEYNDCEFIYTGELDYDADEDGINDHVNMAAIREEHASTGKVTISNCKVDKKFVYFLFNYASRASIKNCKIECFSGIRIDTVENSNEGCILELDNVECLPSCEKIMYVYAAGKRLTINGDLKCRLSNFNIVYGSGTARTNFHNNMQGSFRRIVETDVPFTFESTKDYVSYNSYSNVYVYQFFKGDTFVYTGDNPKQYPSCWVANERDILSTNNGITSNDEWGIPLQENLTAYGYGRGMVTERPECILNGGFRYFDTDLKCSVYWNGEKWTNSDGTNALSLFTVKDKAAKVTTDISENVFRKLRAYFAPVQSGTGDPSPSNIRPITGFTGCNLYATGENIFTLNPIRVISGARTNTDTQKIVSDNYLDLCVYRVPHGNVYARKASGGTMYYNGFSNNSDLAIGDEVLPWSFSWGQTFTVENEYDYIYATVTKNTGYVTGFSLSVGSATDAVVEPSDDLETTAISFSENDTVFYGGYVDLLRGKIVATHANIASYDGETLPGTWISDRDVYAPDATPTTGAQVVYELETPVETDIDPIEFELFENATVLWTDLNGDIEAEYWRH